MKEIIKHWLEHPDEVSRGDATLVIREYCKLYGNREVSDEQLKTIFYIDEHMFPIQYGRLLKGICDHYGYVIKEEWSDPDENGRRTLIRYYIDD